MSKKEYTYNVGLWTIPVLINGDSSHLEPNEEMDLEQFVNDAVGLVDDGEYFHWSTDVDEPSFSRCEVSGKYDMCCQITMTILPYKSPESIEL